MKPIQLNDELRSEGCTAYTRTDQHGLLWLMVEQEGCGAFPFNLVYSEHVDSDDDAQRIALRLTCFDLDDIID